MKSQNPKNSSETPAKSKNLLSSGLMSLLISYLKNGQMMSSEV
ncbi:hypothetical protein [Chryseobacterium sp. 3008163]|nr:hypothetical protein [Chryseobacterium sp. 3008163]